MRLATDDQLGGGGRGGRGGRAATPTDTCPLPSTTAAPIAQLRLPPRQQHVFFGRPRARFHGAPVDVRRDGHRMSGPGGVAGRENATRVLAPGVVGRCGGGGGLVFGGGGGGGGPLPPRGPPPRGWGGGGGGGGGGHGASAWGGAQAGARARAFSAGTRVCRGPPRDGAARAMEWAAAAHPRGRQARHPTGFRPGSAPPMRRAAPRGAAGLPGAAAGCGRPFGRWRVGRPGSHLTREGGVWGGARLEKTALCGDWRAHTSTRPHRLPPPGRPPLDGGPVCRARVGRGDALLPRRPNPARRPHADLQGARRARPGPGCRREPGRGRPQR